MGTPTDSTDRTKSKKSGLRVAVQVVAVLFVVAVIFAIVVPSYGDYTHRAQLSEAVSLLGSAKTPLTEYFEDTKRWPASLDVVVPATSGKYTRAVVISKGAGGTGPIELTATMRSESEGIDGRVAGKTVRLSSADKGKSWTCSSVDTPDKYLPPACRQVHQ